MAKKKPDTSEKNGKVLVIVESPAKAKTINKYLGSDYIVRACKGHVRDLPPRAYGIDPGRNFEPAYEILASHRKVVSELKDAAARARAVYLATDLDREGEAIAWHLATALELTPSKTRRVVFNEITESAIREAFSQPHEIDMDKVNAQQARRILDRVVGYELSPLLWKKISKGLSAGRVQSVAVRLIVEREQAIREFQPEEYWVIAPIFSADLERARALVKEWADYLADRRKSPTGPTAEEKGKWLEKRKCFRAELAEFPEPQPFRPSGTLTQEAGGEWTFTTAVEQAAEAARMLGCEVREAGREPREEYPYLHQINIELSTQIQFDRLPEFVVREVETKRRIVKPPPPFTTASLQQAAANQLRFAASRTMRTAQALYEGVDLKDGQGPVGLITYMRTDSTNLSKDSVESVRGFIAQKYGDAYVPDKLVRYGSAQRAQEAHEAIRPTDVSRTPEALRGHLSADQLKIYTLIWNRFVACQMMPAEWETTAAHITADTPRGRAVFKTSGRVLVFDGFYRVMGVPEGDPLLPPLKQGQNVAPLDLTPAQKFTNPPPRFTEASLVKELEADGIGRPSTYAAIIETIQKRGYVEQIDRRFHPTPRGELVTRKLVEHFPRIMDVKFTSYMEDELDKIEEAHLDWVHVLHEFYDPFKESLGRAHEEMSAVRAEPSEYACEQCGKPMVYRFGKTGRFLACSGYPECKSAMDVDRHGKPLRPSADAPPCEKCGRPMQMRRSRQGMFLGCSGYPECSQIVPCDEEGKPLRKVRPEEIREACPECNAAMSVKFARGRAFLGCSRYPDCKATAPMPEGVYVEKPKPQDAGVRCDRCGRPMVIRKSRRGPFLSCSGFPRCRNAMPTDKLDELKRKEGAGEIPDAPSSAPTNGDSNYRNARNSAGSRSAARGKSRRMSKEEVAALGPPPKGFAWTSTGRPVVEDWPDGPLTCFECGGEMTLRHGRYGPFFGCAKCKAVANLRGDAKKRAEAEAPANERAKPIDTDLTCPDCGRKMLLRMGRTGRFLGCSGYPDCRKTMEAPPGLLRELAAAANGGA